MSRRIEVRVERKGSRGTRVLAPAVGWWLDAPDSGALLGPGSQAGRLQALNHVSDLILPDGVEGRVEREGLERRVPVEYGQLLFRLELLGQGSARPGATRPAASGAGAGLAEGTSGVTAPSDGIFYRRSSPDAAPFVEVGSRVGTGQAVGLVEVMKTFNQIHYGGPGLPSEAQVVEIRCEDGEEVRAGQLLMVFR